MVGLKLRKGAAEGLPHESEASEKEADKPGVSADSRVANSRKYAYRGSFECQ